MTQNTFKVALIGTPNCGKSTIFNLLTGLKQAIGNWPGVTVEKKEGFYNFNNQHITLIDLPGSYNFLPESEDEAVTCNYVHSNEADLFVNVLNSTNLKRSLQLSQQLIKLGKPVLLVANMADIAAKQGININIAKLNQQLPIMNLDATQKPSGNLLKEAIATHLNQPIIIDDKVDIEQLFNAATTLTSGKNITAALDRVALNRYLSLPIFLAIIFAMFYVTQKFSITFIDFFDVVGGSLFIDLPNHLLAGLDWPIVDVFVNSLGMALQTVATFIPPIFIIFFCLTILENSGYMARAAVVINKFMQLLGLSGKSFVPLILGFGCTVPAIMSARILKNRRDKLLTIFITPFMTCSAKLPVLVLFATIFFPYRAALVVFSLYLLGIAVAIVTALLLKKTLFKGKPAPLAMELPYYQLPRMAYVVRESLSKLKDFLLRAGKFIIIATILLGILNNIHLNDREESLLVDVSKAITPVFSPFGVEEENWPASVALITGLFAKEAIITTLATLYGLSEESHENFNFLDSLGEAFATIPENFFSGTLISSDSGESEYTESLLSQNMRTFFNGWASYAYLIFVLLYLPCLAAATTLWREMGWFYGLLTLLYLLIVAWSLATLFYQLTTAHQPLFIILPLIFLAATAAALTIIGRKSTGNFNFTTHSCKNCHKCH
ncbi:MAG: ferrous iron transport protein B [Spirochaetaceae bacterium]|nr:ferrous iron transport protein B [Spirochaetaceae bacterium]